MIIPLFRVVTTQFPIAASTTIEAGMVVALDTNGYAIPCDGDAGGTIAQPVGLAADRNRASEANEWSNRVSDSGNDTAASGMLSVYQKGEFMVDINDSTITTPGGTSIDGVVTNTATTTPGTVARVDDTAATSGMIDSAGSGIAIGVFLQTKTALDSGIPGEYEPGSSVDYVDDASPRTWTKLKLDI